MRKFISAITPIASNGGSRCSRGFSAAASSNVFTPREFVHKGDFESYLAGSFLPSSARDSFFAMRALNIEVASVRDAARGNKVAGHLRMGFWKDFVDKVYRVANATEKGVPVAPEDKIAHPLFEPVLKSVLSHRHTRRWLDRMIDARDKDIDGIPFKTMDDLELYSEHTATSMLYLTLEALGVRDVQADHAASHIGKAAGICTILRALPVHSAKKQRYVPDDILAKHNLSEYDLFIHPEEVWTPEGKPLAVRPATSKKPQHDKPDSGASATTNSDSSARASAFNSSASQELDGALFEFDAPPKREKADRPAIKPNIFTSLGSQASQKEQLPSDDVYSNKRGAGGIRLAPNVAGKTVGISSSPSFEVAKEAENVDPALGAKYETATALLQSGMGASDLVLHKDEEIMKAIREVTFDMACQAKAHLDHAREMAHLLPTEAKAGLLPAVGIGRFLDRLEAQNFDVFSTNGLGPWQDGRPYARFLLQLDYVKHTITNTF